MAKQLVVVNVTGYGSSGASYKQPGIPQSSIGSRLRLVAESWRAVYTWRDEVTNPDIQAQLDDLRDQLTQELHDWQIIVVANGFGAKLMLKLLEDTAIPQLDTLILLNPSLTLDGVRRLLGPFSALGEWFCIRYGFPRRNPAKSVKIPAEAVRWMLSFERAFDWQKIRRHLPDHVTLLSNEEGRDKIFDPKSDSEWLAKALSLEIEETDNQGVFNATRQRLQALTADEGLH